MKKLLSDGNTGVPNAHLELEKEPLAAKKDSSVDPEKGDFSSQHALPQRRLNSEICKLLYCASGIYAAFLYYGSLQEDVFSYTSSNKSLGENKFTAAWFLQFLEALANVVIGYIGLKLTGGSDPKLIPQKMFAISGVSQVCSKAFTSLSLANGISFPVATLAKSCKMAPVMIGQLILGGEKYTCLEYIQVAAIVGGTALLSLGKKKTSGTSHSSPLGLLFILLSLILDGVTGGIQKRIKTSSKAKAKPYDFMFYTNMYMMCVAILISFVIGDFEKGLQFCMSNPHVWGIIIKFSMCSALGQSFIFYTVAHFDPLVCSTITTTRKIFSVLLSIFLKGHKLDRQGWSGVSIACAGILSEVQTKFSSGRMKRRE